MKPAVAIVFALLFSSCVHKLTLHARDGERLDGKWRFAREGSALIQVFGSDGEVLVGMLTPVARGVFLKNYEQTFGAGSIDTAGPELSSYVNAFWLPPGTSNTLADVVYGETFDSTAAQIVTGPLFYWTANLQGDKRTLMQCFLIGSSHTADGLGRCKGSAGKEYTVRF